MTDLRELDVVSQRLRDSFLDSIARWGANSNSDHMFSAIDESIRQLRVGASWSAKGVLDTVRSMVSNAASQAISMGVLCSLLKSVDAVFRDARDAHSSSPPRDTSRTNGSTPDGQQAVNSGDNVVKNYGSSTEANFQESLPGYTERPSAQHSPRPARKKANVDRDSGVFDAGSSAHLSGDRLADSRSTARPSHKRRSGQERSRRSRRTTAASTTTRAKVAFATSTPVAPSFTQSTSSSSPMDTPPSSSTICSPVTTSMTDAHVHSGTRRRKAKRRTPTGGDAGPEAKMIARISQWARAVCTSQESTIIARIKEFCLSLRTVELPSTAAVSTDVTSALEMLKVIARPPNNDSQRITAVRQR